MNVNTPKLPNRNYVDFNSIQELEEIIDKCFEEGFESCSFPGNLEGTIGTVEFWKVAGELK